MKQKIKNMRESESGFALIAVLVLIALMTTILGAYIVITRIELATARSSQDTASGFYAAEGGLNLRAGEIRNSFVGYTVPSGTSPTDINPCQGSNLGSGMFACSSRTLSNRSVQTYIKDHQAGGNPTMIKIPQGELFQNLWAQEYRYTASSIAKGKDSKTEALLQLRFKSRLVPLFQFAAFFNKDLEILPGPNMVLTGPVHANGDLYLNSENTLSLNSQVTCSGNMYRGRKNTNACNGTVRAMDPSSYRTLVSGCSERRLLTNALLTPYNGMLQQRVESVTVPEPSALDSATGALYWDRADLRLVLNLTAASALDTAASTHPIRVYNQNNTLNSSHTNQLNACTGAIRWTPPGAGAAVNRVVGSSQTFRNVRESNKMIRMLDIDMRGLLTCLHTTNWFGTSKALNENSDGGLVFHFTVRGPNQNSSANEYGIRLANGETLAGPAGSPAILGLTVVSDQAVFVAGHYNRLNKKPAAVMADSFNVLSNSWYSSASGTFTDALSTQVLANRTPTDTTHNIAVLAGSDSTGDQEGSSGQGGNYSGGLENFPRFHENWNGNRTYNYRGSFVSLNRPRRVNGDWGQNNVYSAPARNWDYDTSFNNAANLPPLSPRFVYLKQELFVRDFEQ
jgi:hypothetical protein